MKTVSSSKNLENQGSVTRRGGYLNRVIAVLLCAVIAVCLLPVMEKNVKAAQKPNYTIIFSGSPYSTMEEGYYIDEDGKTVRLTFRVWCDSCSMPATPGNYYLDRDIVLGGTWSITSGTYNICLNGKNIIREGNSPVIYISESDTVLNLFDISGNNGKITHHERFFDNGIVIDHGATFNMFGGEISGNETNGSITNTYKDGGGVCVNQGTFNMYGGKISGNKAAGNGNNVYINNSNDPASMKMVGGTIDGGFSERHNDYVTISFNSGSGSGTMTPQYISRYWTIRLKFNEFTPANMIFDCWKVGETTYADGANIRVSDDTELIAQWKAKTAINPTVDITGWKYGEYSNTTNDPVVSGNSSSGETTIYYEGTGSTSYTKSKNIPVNAGTYKVIAEIAETDTYASAAVSKEFSIAKRAVTLTSAGAEKDYDGTPLTNSTVSVSGDGFLTGEGATYEVTGSQTGQGTSDNSFTYRLNSGTSADNYDIKTVKGELKVNKRNITITAKDQSVELNGSFKTDKDQVTLSGSGLATGQELTEITLTSDITTTSVGTGEMTPSAAKIMSGTTIVTGNYNINYEKGNLSVTPKSLGSDAIRLSAEEFAYDGTAKTPEVSVYDGEIKIPESEYTVKISDNVNAGTATVEVSDVTGGNYTVKGKKTYKIKEAEVTVTANDLSKAYGEKDPVYTATVKGLKGNDTESVINYTSSRTEGEDAGTYSITPTGDEIQGNYKVSYVPGSLVINPVDPEYTVPQGLKSETGKRLSDIELPDGWKWVDATASVGEAGKNTFKAVFTPKDKVNYNVVGNIDITVEVTEAKKEPGTKLEPDSKPEPNYNPAPVITYIPEEPDTVTDTVINNDGSATTTTKIKNEDGTISESTVREWKNGNKNVTEIIKDADGKVLSTLTETVRISKRGTKTEKTDIQKADGYHSSTSVKTYKSGKEVTSSSTSFANGAKQAYTETKNADGTLTRKVMDTNTKGKSTLTVTTVVWGDDDSVIDGSSENIGSSGVTTSNSGEVTENKKKLIKAVTKYKVTGDGKIRLTSIKTEGDTAIIPKTVTFDGEKNMIVSLGKGLFKGMEGIKEIYIYAENLKKIYAGAFEGVPADAKFYIKATAINCKKIVRMIQKSGFGKVDYTKI